MALLSSDTIAHAGLLLGKKDREKGEYRQERIVDDWLMTYYVGYQNDYLKPADIDYTLMTHIVVGGVGVKEDGTLNEHWHLNNGKGRDMAEDVGRRAKREGVKTLIWLGGPNEEDQFFSATSEKNRKAFVKNILTLIEELGYDGVDIDWEPVRKKDEPRLLALVRDLRNADPSLLITVPVNWVPSSILFSKDLSVYEDIARYVDKLFIMSYSMAGPWPQWESWHGSALTGQSNETPSSIKTSVYAYRRAGVPKDQLGIGIGTYATCWEYPVRKPNQVLPLTFYSNALHTMSMRTMFNDYYKSTYERWDSRAKAPYLSMSVPTGELQCGFISYENERSVEEKVKYVKRMDLGGVLVWNIGTGYFPQNSRHERHVLLEHIRDAF
jgi:chitinase